LANRFHRALLPSSFCRVLWICAARLTAWGAGIQVKNQRLVDLSRFSG
jgi:hypothetical protein